MKQLLKLIIMGMVIATQAEPPISQVFGEVPKLPLTVLERINEWLVHEPEIMRRLIVQDNELVDFRAIHRANNEYLLQRGIKNHSHSNYVFECPAVPEYFIKVSGPINRLVNVIVANDKWPTTTKSDDLKTLRRTVTYQTISSLPTYFLYLRLSKESPLKHVYIPNTYLVHVPGTDESLSDGNYIVVQEKIQLVEAHDEQKLLKALSSEQLCELVRVICACGLWDTNGKIKFSKDGRIVIVDLEQPNTSNPLRDIQIIDQGCLLKRIFFGINSLRNYFKDDEARIHLINITAHPFLEQKTSDNHH